jgi:hypothetical protein
VPHRQLVQFGLCCAFAGGACAACHASSGAQPNAAETPRNSGAESSAVANPGPASRSAFALSAQNTPSAAALTFRALPAVVDAGVVVPAAPVASVTPSAGATTSTTPSAGATNSTPPALLDAEGKPLPQTDQRPSLDSPSFRQRIDALANAILSGDAEPAKAAFFPLVAYRQVKDVAKPERDYKFRLLANFGRDLGEYHRALGSAAAKARFTGVTVSERDAKWMGPGSEGNKLGYFRVLHSRLHFTLPTGRSRDLELTSLISWRGEWYVVHLHGFE